MNTYIRELFVREVKGGQGSGNFGHEGRPGEVGGSGPGGGGSGSMGSYDRAVTSLEKGTGIPRVTGVLDDSGSPVETPAHILFFVAQTEYPKLSVKDAVRRHVARTGKIVYSDGSVFNGRYTRAGDDRIKNPIPVFGGKILSAMERQKD